MQKAEMARRNAQRLELQAGDSTVESIGRVAVGNAYKKAGDAWLQAAFFTEDQVLQVEYLQNKVLYLYSKAAFHFLREITDKPAGQPLRLYVCKKWLEFESRLCAIAFALGDKVTFDFGIRSIRNLMPTLESKFSHDEIGRAFLQTAKKGISLKEPTLLIQKLYEYAAEHFKKALEKKINDRLLNSYRESLEGLWNTTIKLMGDEDTNAEILANCKRIEENIPKEIEEMYTKFPHLARKPLSKTEHYIGKNPASNKPHPTLRRRKKI